MTPLSQEFLHHLDELMRGTTESLYKELADHTNELVAAARKTNNSAGIPLAYSEASIDNFRTRVSATIDKYLDALGNCGIVVDAAVESEMLQKIHQLTHSHVPLTFPPTLRVPNATAVIRSHAMAMMREGTALQRQAANRLRELKMKASRNIPAPEPMTPPQPFTIASVAPTLAVLKALPMQEQAMLLLRRLVQIYPIVRNTDKFHKGNILLPNDNWQIAMGFPASENMIVRRHLLGGPWSRLVVEGYLVDPGGQGFHDISPEGFAAAEEAAKPKQPVPVQTTESEKPVEFDYPDRPVAFMSYSWESEGHKRWVLALAKRLYGNGINVILDQWHLRLGMDKTLFMENGIAESDFVLIVCTPVYATKANKRRGGVGYEAMIITGELADDILETKFIPVLRMGEWDKTSMPRWLKTKTGADLRGNPYNEEQYNLLVRELHGEYLKPPAAGPKPDFLPISTAPASADAPAPAVQPVRVPAHQGAVLDMASQTRRKSNEQPQITGLTGNANAPEHYWKERSKVPETDLLKRMWPKTRWCIWIYPVEFKPARFRNIEDCQRFVISAQVPVFQRGSFPTVLSNKIEIGREWISSEFEHEQNALARLERWILYRSGQFVHRQTLGQRWESTEQIHALEILYTVTAAFEFAAKMADRGILSPEGVITFELWGIDGRALTWPEASGGDDRISLNCWSQEQAINLEKQFWEDELKQKSRELALASALEIYARFGWLDPLEDKLRDIQTESFR